jgi:hypothetical protein
MTLRGAAGGICEPFADISARRLLTKRSLTAARRAISRSPRNARPPDAHGRGRPIESGADLRIGVVSESAEDHGEVDPQGTCDVARLQPRRDEPADLAGQGDGVDGTMAVGTGGMLGCIPASSCVFDHSAEPPGGRSPFGFGHLLTRRTR